MSRTSTKPRKTRLPDSYFELVKRHPLRSIQSDAELDGAQAIMDELLRQELDSGGQAYLDTLSDLVLLYERDHHAIPPLNPQELLSHLLEDRRMSQADLVRKTGIAKATVSDLVSGKRSFTVEQMHAIASVFGLPGKVFLPRAEKVIES
ncbi:MAG TPA: helix-turn-helix domain-containing protein [Gemmataceae bacterium]|nr:helix-turn-helix domain-containing protein [Gemmataceae bacterium]